MRSYLMAGGAAVLASLMITSSAAAIPIMPDTFEDGTTMGWFVPGAHPSPPANMASGGPAGVDDNFLLLTALGAGMDGSKLSVLNETQWAGDYLAAGITSIFMDVKNFGPDDVTLRLLLEDFDAPGPPTNLATTLTDVVVPAGGDWMRVEFSLSAANLVALVGDIDEVLREVDVLRIFHNTVPNHPGPPVGPPAVNAAVGVDNITAAVPEPATLLLSAAGLAAVLRRRQRGSARR